MITGPYFVVLLTSGSDSMILCTTNPVASAEEFTGPDGDWHMEVGLGPFESFPEAELCGTAWTRGVRGRRAKLDRAPELSRWLGCGLFQRAPLEVGPSLYHHIVKRRQRSHLAPE